MENNLKVGHTEDGHSYLGGDPADEKSWMAVGTVEDGHSFVGGDPAEENSWVPAEQDTPDMPTQTSGLQAAAGGISSGGMFGFADEAMGGIKALGAKAGILDSETKSVFDEDVNLKDEYQAQRDKFRGYQDTLKKEHPKTYTGAEIGTAVGTGLVGGGANLLARAGGEAAAFGLGESEADLTEGEYAQAAKDTAIGGAIGLGTAGLMKGGGKAYNKFIKPGMEKRAATMAKKGATELLDATPSNITKLDRVNALDDLPTYLKEKGFTGNIQKLSDKVDDAIEGAGKTIGDVADTVDNFFPNLGKKATDKVQKRQYDTIGKLLKKQNTYDFNTVADDLEKEVLEGIKNIPGYKTDVKKVSNYVAELREVGKVDSLVKLNQIRKGIDKKIGWGKAEPGIMDDIYKTVRRHIATHVKDNILPTFDQIRIAAAKNRLLDKAQLSTLDSTAEALNKANREYFMGSKVQDLISKAAGKTLKRGSISKTDTTLGALLGTASIASGNPMALAPLAAKKVYDYAAPRVGLRAPELLKGAEKLGGAVQKGLDTVAPLRPAMVQQATQETATRDNPSPWTENVEGTPYKDLFKGEDPKTDAVNHKVLMSTDPEYRKLHLKRDE